MNGAARPPDPELLGFLQSLVNEGQGQSQQDRTDSDKENEQARMQQEQQQRSAGDGGVSSKAADDALWDDFYNEEDFRPKPKGPAAPPQSPAAVAADHRVADDDYGRDRFESLERVEEEEEDDEDSNTAARVESGAGGDAQKKQEQESLSSPGDPKPKKKKRFFTKVERPASAKNTPDLAGPTVSGGSHPDLSNGRGERVNLHSQQETMSETSGRGRRRLSRRKQVARPRCAGPEPTGDLLQQKYQELQVLMVRPLVEPGQYVQQTRQQLRRLEGISRQHAQAVIADTLLPPARGSKTRTGHRVSSHNGQHSSPRRAFVELTENNTEEGYSTLRTVQVTNHAEHRPRSAQHRKLRPSSAHAPKGRPLSAHQPRAAKVPPASNTNDRVLEYVANSVNPRAPGRVKSGRKNDSNAKSNKSSAESSSNSNNTININTDTGESTNEASTTSSHKNNEITEDKGRDRSSSSDQSRSRSGSGSRRDKRSRSNSSSPCRSPRHQTETHLKHSNNPALRKWLRRKEREMRKKKKEERAQQLAEELDKQEEKRKRESLFQDSDKKVKEWMVKKRKEAVRQAREERRRQMEEEKERKEREAVQQQYNSPFRLTERPQSAPSGQLTHHGRKLFIPIIRPERPIAGGNGTHQNANSNSSETDGKKEGNEEELVEPKIPRPPLASKFVYKRPVSGRVRLMKLQQEKKADAKRTELEKMLHEKKLAEEKAKKMRMSYDQWLIKKRSEDYEKRQEAARQRALAKSDPELERIVPEVARRRIENIQRGKRRVTTGDKTIDSEVNKSFGGGDFPSDQATNTYRLEISGSALKQRPSSAKASLNPRVSRSPRRPQSAHPRVKSVMEENHDMQKNAFKLPFPEENGAPKHVLARQEKLFAHHLTHPETSSTPSEAQPQQPQQQKQDEKKVLESPTTSATFEHPQTQTKDNDDKERDEEDVNSSSFFVTDGNIEQNENSGENKNASQEEMQQRTEKDQSGVAGKEERELQTEQQNLSTEEVTENVKDFVSEETSTETNISTEQTGKNTEVQNDGTKSNKDDNNPDSMTKNEDEIIENNAHEDGNDSLQLELDDCDDVRMKLASEAGVGEEGLSADGATGTNTDTSAQEKEESEGMGLDVGASRHSTKRVSFQEETQVYEPSDLGDDIDDDQFYLDDNDNRVNTSSDDFSDNFDKDDDDAEDERGNYFGDETPRDDDNDDF